jgi:hypothetical protein
LTALIDTLSRAKGDRAPMTLQARGYLAEALHTAGRPAEAARVLAEVRAIAREALGERHRITRQLDRLADETAS